MAKVTALQAIMALIKQIKWAKNAGIENAAELFFSVNDMRHEITTITGRIDNEVMNQFKSALEELVKHGYVEARDGEGISARGYKRVYAGFYKVREYRITEKGINKVRELTGK